MKSIELLVTRDIKRNGIAICLKPSVDFVLTPSIAHEIRNFQNNLCEQYLAKPWDRVFFVIWFLSSSNSVSWRGLDFKFILNCLKKKREDKLEGYLHEVFDLLYLNHVALGLPVANCSIINRKLVGISQEFFLLNQINFLKQEGNANTHAEKILPLSLDNYYTNKVFPNSFYDKGILYGFNSINLGAMRKILSKYQHKALYESELLKIKAIFENKKIETIESIYYLATHKFKALERMTQIQSRDYP